MISFFNKIFVSKQNRPRFAASHLDLFFLPMSHKKDTRLVIWVKYFNQNPACYHVCVIIEHRPIIRPRLSSQLTTCTIHINIGNNFLFNACLDYEYARKTYIFINYMYMYTCVLNSVLNFDH